MAAETLAEAASRSRSSTACRASAANSCWPAAAGSTSPIPNRWTFLARYGPAQARLTPLIRAFPPEALIRWCEGLGRRPSSGVRAASSPRRSRPRPCCAPGWRGSTDWASASPRAPTGAAGLLMARCGWSAPMANSNVRPDATILALGGASWPRLGADGSWASVLRGEGLPVADLVPSNVGVRIAWSAPLLDRFEGAPLKGIVAVLRGMTARGRRSSRGWGSRAARSTPSGAPSARRWRRKAARDARHRPEARFG